MKRAEELALLWLDGELPESDAGELDTLLGDADASRRVASLLELEFALRGAAHEIQVTDKVLQTLRSEVGGRIAARVVEEVKLGAGRPVLPCGGSRSDVAAHASRGLSRQWRWVTPLAASIAVLVAGGLVYRASVRQPPPKSEEGGLQATATERRMAGRVTEVAGEVRVSVLADEAQPMAAHTGDALFEGSRILTGNGESRCRIDVADGNVGVTVYNQSVVVLKGGGTDRQVDGEVDIQRGELEAEVRRKGTHFAVSSVAGKAEAIGTRFRVKLEKESEMNSSRMVMLTTVFSGVVLVSNPFGSLNVLAGESATVTVGGAPAGVTVRRKVPEERGDAHEARERAEMSARATIVPTAVTKAPTPVITLKGKLTKTTDDRYILTVASNEPNEPKGKQIPVTTGGAAGAAVVDLAPFVGKEVKATVNQSAFGTIVTAIEEVKK